MLLHRTFAAFITVLVFLLSTRLSRADETKIADVSFGTPIGEVKLAISYDSNSKELVKRGSINGVPCDTHRTSVTKNRNGLLIYHEHEDFNVGAKWEFDVAVDENARRSAGYRIRAGARNPVTRKFEWSKWAAIHPEVVDSLPPPLQDGIYVIRNVYRSSKKTNSMLDVHAEQGRNGVELSADGGGDGRRWKVTHVEDGEYTIENVYRSKKGFDSALDIHPDSKQIDVYLSASSRNEGRRWRLIAAENGGLHVVSVYRSNRQWPSMLDVHAEKDRIEPELSATDGGDGRLWNFEKVQ